MPWQQSTPGGQNARPLMAPLWCIYPSAATPEGWIELAWHFPNTDRNRDRLTYCKCSVREAEVHAIHHALIESTRHITAREPTSSNRHRVAFFADCHAAIRACTSHSATSRAVRMILTTTRALQALGFQIPTSWIPGYEGIPGNARVP